MQDQSYTNFGWMNCGDMRIYSMYNGGYSNYSEYTEYNPQLMSYDFQSSSASMSTYSTVLPEIVLTEPNPSKNQKCMVCNLIAHGMHFGVMTCRPCAAFFRRIVVLGLKYNCIQNNQKCNVDGRGRNVCRDCRFQRCLSVGMTTDNVQYNRSNKPNQMTKVTKMNKQRMKASSPPDVVGRYELEASQRDDDDQDTDESCSACDDDFRDEKEVKMVEDDETEMDEILRDLKNLFVEYRPPKIIVQYSSTQLQKLCSALLLHRKNQKDASQIQFRESIFFLTDGLSYYTRRSYKFSKWIVSVDFFNDLSEEDKITVVKLCFVIFDRLERSHMSAKLFGESSFKEQKLAMSSYCAIDVKTVKIDPEPTVDTVEARTYLINEFYKTMTDLCENLIQPIFKLQITDTEITFMLVQLLSFNMDKAPQHLAQKFVQLEKQIGLDLHQYYTAEIKLADYSERLKKMMEIVEVVKKQHTERLQKIELLNVFDIYQVSKKRQQFINN